MNLSSEVPKQNIRSNGLNFSDESPNLVDTINMELILIVIAVSLITVANHLEIRKKKFQGS